MLPRRGRETEERKEGGRGREGVGEGEGRGEERGRREGGQ